ncbi:unnamed protein product, partial [Porites evermanni]
YASLLAHQCLQDHQRVSSTMNVKISLLFFVAVAVYAKAELEQQYHPQAVLHYLEMEDKKMAEKVRSIVKLPDEDPARPSFRPSGFPTGIPPKVKVCIVAAVICHKKAGDDACAHLQCIKTTGLCLKRAGVGIKDLPPNVRKCLPIIPCCLLVSESCEEKLCCFVRFGECAKKLGDKS